jgi:hypothetical protein
LAASRRMVFSVVRAAILRGSQELAPQDDVEIVSQARRPGRRWCFSSFDFQWEDVAPRSRDTLRPSFANSFTPKKKEGAGKTGCTLHPRSRVQKQQNKTHTSIQVQRKHSGLPCAMALQLISCSPRRDQSLFVTVIPRKRELPENLTPAIGASGPHDFAVRECLRSSFANTTSTASHRACRDVAQRPSHRAGWSRSEVCRVAR